jgi:hypothetical protein
MKEPVIIRAGVVGHLLDVSSGGKGAGAAETTMQPTAGSASNASSAVSEFGHQFAVEGIERLGRFNLGHPDTPLDSGYDVLAHGFPCSAGCFTRVFSRSERRAGWSYPRYSLDPVVAFSPRPEAPDDDHE